MEILGYERQLIIGKSINEFTIEKIDLNTFKDRNNSEVYVLLRKSNGQTLHMDTKYECIYSKEKSRQINILLIDVTKYVLEKEKLRILLQICEKSNDIIYSIDLKPELRYNYLNPAMEKNLGYTTVQEHINDPLLVFEMTHPDYYDIQSKKKSGEIDFNKPVVMKYRNKLTGKYIWFEDYVNPIYDEAGALVQLYGINRNIQERKELEEKLIYMSYHDILTGLFNRAYFEKEVKRLNNVINTKIGILVCDLDNLKEINDKLRHKQGDQLIKESGKIIEESFKKCSVFRIGEDEFTVILDNIGIDEVEAKIINLKSQISRYNKSKPKIPIKISIGFSYYEHSLGQVAKVFKQADRNMYKDKLNNKIV